MSGAGAPDLAVDARGMRVAIIAGSWHEEIMSSLIDGARDSLAAAGAAHEVFRVAGAFELPLAAQTALAEAPDGGGFDAAVCLGVIIRGGTPHFEYVCAAVTDGLTRAQLDAGRPVGFGVLTTDTEQQALDRSGRPGAPESKGREAAEAALHLAVAQRAIRGGR
ncbi:6,7-dimethyl-8-ribityllumazine synthase [Leucobacter allii]|uniref:6,7-dimethyl-8-ribityllumazine synthase n=1 Tax=Leucobacter allii TaxID=2932247 RepID=A0ABY4FLY8_9MICO|nr:6,7-dimethyl-8-ribityllumazine synthase [Leucobacter allii]UOQ57311.1 6,7-dimethyl-8-ribityllumazine synthase [Leucobacter allii]UOR01760.1 6,7-dimethyl-8-ribityllumazine synthase [Leucobacter allii]